MNAKIFCLLVFCWLAPRPGWAQKDVIDDLEDGNLQSPNAIWRCSSFKLEATTEQAREGSYSVKVTYAKKGDADKWGFIEIEPDLRDFSKRPNLSIWVRGSVSLLVKLWNSKERQQDVGTQTAADPAAWTQLKFDCANSRLIDLSDVQRVLLFPEPGKTDCSGVFYVDSLALIDAGPQPQSGEIK